MKRKKIKPIKIDATPIFLIAFLLVISISLAQNIESATYRIPRSSIDSGGGNFTSSNYFLEVSTEPVGGNSSANTYAVCIGINCCPADVIARWLNSSIDAATSTATVAFALWHSDICMGTTNVTVECASNCDPCTGSCDVSTTYHTLERTDILIARNTVSVSNVNGTNPVYCRVTDNTFQLERCFTSPTNMTVTVEAGGPYTGNAATIIVAGNVTYDDDTAIEGANVTIDLFRSSNLFDYIGRVIVNTTQSGRYFATFASIGADTYRVNVTAAFQSLRANNTDTVDVVSVHGNCQIKTITLGGRALDATTGYTIPSGGASLTIEQTGDKKDTTITAGVWSTDMVTCFVSGERYTVTVKITDTTGKISWSEIHFVAP